MNHAFVQKYNIFDVCLLILPLQINFHLSTAPFVDNLVMGQSKKFLQMYLSGSRYLQNVRLEKVFRILMHNMIKILDNVYKMVNINENSMFVYTKVCSIRVVSCNLLFLSRTSVFGTYFWPSIMS